MFFGFTASGLFDLKPTPLGGVYPGVEVNATMLDNLLSGDFMRVPSTASTVLLLLLLCIGAGLAVSSVSRVGWSILIYVLFLPLAPALGIAAYAMGYWLQVVALELGVVFSLVGSNLASYATEGRQKRYIKGAFSQYLSPTVIEELIAHPERLTLGGERRELTIFFSDVQGFTTISEALTPEDLTALLNEYLTAMVDIIQEEGGTIDKFEGDAIIAFWNAPLSQEDHAVRGVRAALRCQAKLAEMRPSIHARIGKNMFMRVGMNTGQAVVGNMGSKTRFDYTMLGDQVNLSARLEGINKQFGTYFMISAATREKIAGAFPARELSRVAVVGRKEPVTVYEPMLPEEFAARKADPGGVRPGSEGVLRRAVHRGGADLRRHRLRGPARGILREEMPAAGREPSGGRMGRRLGNDGEVDRRYIRVMSETHDGAVPGTTPIRLFPSDTLEFFTHVHPAMVPVVWVPVAAVFLVRGVSLAGAAGHPWSPGARLRRRADPLDDRGVPPAPIHLPFHAPHAPAEESVIPDARGAPRAAAREDPAGHAPDGERAARPPVLPAFLRGGFVLHGAPDGSRARFSRGSSSGTCATTSPTTPCTTCSSRGASGSSCGPTTCATTPSGIRVSA